MRLIFATVIAVCLLPIVTGCNSENKAESEAAAYIAKLYPNATDVRINAQPWDIDNDNYVSVDVIFNDGGKERTVLLSCGAAGFNSGCKMRSTVMKE